MKVILNTEFDIFTYKAVGAAVGILIYALLAYKLPQVDLLVASMIAFLIGSLVWYFLSFIFVKRNGLCIEFRYSKNRPRVASVALSKQFKQLDYMEFALPIQSSAHKQDLDDQVLVKLKHFFARHLCKINEFEVIQFVGCTQRDVNQISKLVSEMKSDMTTRDGMDC